MAIPLGILGSSISERTPTNAPPSCHSTPVRPCGGARGSDARWPPVVHVPMSGWNAVSLGLGMSASRPISDGIYPFRFRNIVMRDDPRRLFFVPATGPDIAPLGESVAGHAHPQPDEPRGVTGNHVTEIVHAEVDARKPDRDDEHR